MKQPIIDLTEKQLRDAVSVGTERQIRNLFNNRKPRYKCHPADDWKVHIQGALGEKVVSLYLGIPWDGNMDQLSLPDVGTFQVRATPWPDGHLIVHKKDSDDQFFILVTGINLRHTIRGYRRADQVKIQKYWGELKKGRPAFNVPQSDLHSIEYIKRKLEKAQV